MRGFELIRISSTDDGAGVSLLLGVAEALRGRRVLYLDAANSFNPYALARLLRRHRLDRGLLRNVLVSRAFTCHQLEALVRDRLDPAVRRHCADTVLVSDAGALLYDEEVPAAEALRVACSIAAHLVRVCERIPCRLVLGPPRPDREPLLAALRSRAGRVHVWEELPWDGPLPRLPSSFTPR